ncbi:MAG: HRDC domain-containing protein [Candidatus Kariarchaeaceae archaeon]
MNTPDYQLVDSQDQLLSVIDVLQKSRTLAVDIEFDNKYSFDMVLCLVQISTGSKIYLIDALSVDLTPLSSIFSNESIIKLFFAGIQDIQIIQTIYGWNVRSIIDLSTIYQVITQDGSQASLNDMVSDVLKIDLPKNKKIQSKEDWKQRPLPDEMLDYAAGDVRYLHRAVVAMQRSLTAEQQQLLEVYFLQIPLVWDLEPNTLIYAFSLASKMKGIRQEHRYLMFKLVEFRNDLAKKKRTSPGYILSRKQLKTLVRERPKSVKDLKRLDLNHGSIKRYSQQLLDTIKIAMSEFHSKDRDNQFYDINGIYHDHYPYHKILDNNMEWPYKSSIQSYRNRQGILRIINQMVLDRINEEHLSFVFSKYLVHGLARSESINLNDLRPLIDEVSSFEDGIELSRTMVRLVYDAYQS